jgi:hypothetical protein
MSTFTLDELIAFLNKYPMVPKLSGIGDDTYLDHRIIRDEDLPTPQCLVAKYMFLAFEEDEPIWKILQQFIDLTHVLAISICYHDKSSPADIKKQRILDMLQLIGQLVTNFVMYKNSERLPGIILNEWRVRNPEPADASTMTKLLQELGITDPQTE